MMRAKKRLMIVKGYTRGHDIDFSGEKTRLNTKLLGKLKSGFSLKILWD